MSSPGCGRFDKERDRRSGAALRSQERGLLEKKGKERRDAWMMRIVVIKTRVVGQKFQKKIGVCFLLKAQGCGQYLFVAVESRFCGRGRHQHKSPMSKTPKEFTEIPQIRLGEIDEDQVAGYGADLPVPA